MLAVPRRVRLKIRPALTARLERPLHGHVGLTQHLRPRRRYLHGSVSSKLGVLIPKRRAAILVILQRLFLQPRLTVRSELRLHRTTVRVLRDAIVVVGDLSGFMVVLMAGDARTAGGDERAGGRPGGGGWGFIITTSSFLPHLALISFNLPTNLLRLGDRLVVLGGGRVGAAKMLRQVRAVLGTALVTRGSLGGLAL